MKEHNESVVETVSRDLIKDIFKDFENPVPPSVEATQIEEEKLVEEALKTPEAPLSTEPEKEPVIEVKPDNNPQTDYSKKLKSLIRDGIIENFAVNYKEGDEEEKSVFIEDIDTLTEEGYVAIIEGWKKAQKEEINSKYISVDGLDDTTKKLIEIRKAGGDISEIIKENVTTIDYLTKLKENLDREDVQINIVGQSLQNKGLSPKVIEAQIKDYIENGTLETEASAILDAHLTIQNDAIEEKRALEIQRQEKEKEDLKNLKKTLTSKYKEMNLPDNIVKVAVENATKLDQDRISNTDKLYFEATKDPEFFAELNLFLNNREAFKKYVSTPKVREAKIESQKALFTVNINKTNKPKLSASSLEEFADEVINNTK